jgi:hypothetical protein
MIPIYIDYASTSVFQSTRDSTLLGIAANARRPVRFHGRVVKEIPLLRFALRALGEAIWSDDTWLSEGEFWAGLLDPVITIHPDRIFFEAFSQDQSVYASVILDPALFATEGEVSTGTTNIDFTAWLWAALNDLRSSRETWFRIESGGFEVATKTAGGRFERKVDLPDDWVRGFLQITGAMAMPGTRVVARPADLLAAIRFLRYTKAKVSPRGLRYEFNPGQDTRIVLEPWEQIIPLRGAEHNYAQPHVIRTWGRRRLSLIEPLLPFADEVHIYLKGRSLPSFYAVKMPGITFILGLSGWTEQKWTDSGSFDLLGESHVAKTEDDQLLAQLLPILAKRYSARPKDLVTELKKPADVIWRACERLCRQGRAIYDIEMRAFRHRELFETPIDEQKVYPPDLRIERAEQWIRDSSVRIDACEPVENRKVKNLKTPEGRIIREIIFRDWRVQGGAGDQPKTEIVINDLGRIIFGVCGCAFFQENILNKGPCEHMIALFRQSAPLRADLPSSIPAEKMDGPGPRPSGEEDEEDEEKREEEQDDNSEDEEDEEEN